jgi:tRNA threonylcarbamoyladenosine biosynthesis protein TsaE
METSFHLGELEKFAEQFWSSIGRFRVFAFHGQMGAGKTTIIGAICRYRGVTSHVSSPTFSIINEYVSATDSSVRIFHMDLYRLRDEEETESAGVSDVLRSGDYCFVEWPERAPLLFDEDTLHVYVETVSEDLRRVALKMP